MSSPCTRYLPLSPYTAKQLPLTLISLEDWSLVTLSGPDSRRYLQGQVTCDVTTLQHDRYLLGAHCDANGKMWSCFHLFVLADQLALLQRRSVCEKQLEALRQYAVFSKVVIKQDDAYRLLGVAGTGARAALQHIFPHLPTAEAPCLAIEDTVLLHFSAPGERFLVITPQSAKNVEIHLLQQGAECRQADQWLVLEIASGMPIIDAPNTSQLLPQAVNLDRLRGISFTKGCYLGQEGVARAQYRGTNKRATYWLSGQSHQLPVVAEALELQLGEQWRASGRVLATVRFANDIIWVQAVLNYPLAANLPMRVKRQPESRLQCQPLPYALSDNNATVR